MNLSEIDGAGTPIVSIILPSYNREASLENAIESVLAQSFQDWELIVSDDGSTDGTAQLVASYHEFDSRIVYLPGSRKGISRARNRAMMAARGHSPCGRPRLVLLVRICSPNEAGRDEIGAH